MACIVSTNLLKTVLSSTFPFKFLANCIGIVEAPSLAVNFPAAILSFVALVTALATPLTLTPLCL